MHQFYQTVTVAGKASYLRQDRPEDGIVMPQQFRQQQIEERLAQTNTWKGAGWKTVDLEPHLTRQEATANQDGDDEAEKRASLKLENQQTSYME